MQYMSDARYGSRCFTQQVKVAEPETSKTIAGWISNDTTSGMDEEQKSVLCF